MKRLLLSTVLPIVVGAFYFGAIQSADAALLTLNDTNGCGGACEGLTYTLESQATANPLTEQFALLIQGVNVVGTDTRLGRTGIDAFAFNLVNNQTNSPTTGAVTGTIINNTVALNPANWTFKNGGLNSTGCNSTGNFFCFDNTAIDQTVTPQIVPTTPLTPGSELLVFTATLLAGDSWANYSTALKINWVGSANNYSLVSKDIPLNTTCPDCSINPVIVDASEPASLAVLGFGLLGTLAAARRQTRLR